MGIRNTLKTSFVAGVILLAPLFVTLLALQFVLGFLRGALGPIIEGTRYVQFVGDIEIAAELLAILIVLVVVVFMGYLAQRRLGQLVFGYMDRAIGFVPMVSVIYGSVRQVSNALTRDRSRFESVALIEYPREGSYAMGFVTAESPATISEAVGEPAVNVYVAKSPNPTAGDLLMVPESQITELDMSVSRAIRLLVTTGMAEDPRELEEFREEVGADIGEEIDATSDRA